MLDLARLQVFLGQMPCDLSPVWLTLQAPLKQMFITCLEPYDFPVKFGQCCPSRPRNCPITFKMCELGGFFTQLEGILSTLNVKDDIVRFDVALSQHAQGLALVRNHREWVKLQPAKAAHRQYADIFVPIPGTLQRSQRKFLKERSALLEVNSLRRSSL